MQFSYPSNLSKKVNFKQKMCTHTPFGPKTIGYQRAMVYLKLRENGCKDKDALRFASKNICMSDSTLPMDGPANFRKLKVKKNSKQITVNGWLNVPHEYKMGKKYINGKHEILQDSKMEKRMLRKMHELDSKEKKKFHKKIGGLHDFLKKSKNKYKFRGLPKKKLLDKLKELNKHIDTSKKKQVNYQEETDGRFKKAGKVEDELMNFIQYIYDLCSTNFKEEGDYFKDQNVPKRPYSNRMMSSKIKEFKEIQSEFNTANYVYSKLNPEEFKSNDSKFLKNNLEFPFDSVASIKRDAESTADSYREKFYYGQKDRNPTKNLSFKSLEKLKEYRKKKGPRSTSSVWSSKLEGGVGVGTFKQGYLTTDINLFRRKKNRSKIRKPVKPRERMFPSYDKNMISRIFSKKKSAPLFRIKKSSIKACKSTNSFRQTDGNLSSGKTSAKRRVDFTLEETQREHEETSSKKPLSLKSDQQSVEHIEVNHQYRTEMNL